MNLRTMSEIAFCYIWSAMGHLMLWCLFPRHHRCPARGAPVLAALPVLGSGANTWPVTPGYWGVGAHAISRVLGIPDALGLCWVRGWLGVNPPCHSSSSYGALWHLGFPDRKWAVDSGGRKSMRRPGGRESEALEPPYLLLGALGGPPQNPGSARGDGESAQGIVPPRHFIHPPLAERIQGF